MKNLLSLFVFGFALLPSGQAELFLQTDFEDRSLQGWEVSAKLAVEPPAIEVIEVEPEGGSAGGHVLRLNDTEHNDGPDSSYDLSLWLPHAVRDQCTLTFRIRFLAEGGDHPRADVRLSIRDVADVTYLRFRTGPGEITGVSHHDRLNAIHVQSQLAELYSGAWYTVQIRFDMDRGTYSWAVDNDESDEPGQHAKADDLPFYHPAMQIQRISLVSLVRGGVFELDDVRLVIE